MKVTEIFPTFSKKKKKGKVVDMKEMTNSDTGEN